MTKVISEELIYCKIILPSRGHVWLLKKIYEDAGGLDENLAVAYNDIVFCLKIMKLCYYNVYIPYAILYHYESITSDTMIQKKSRTGSKKR